MYPALSYRDVRAALAWVEAAFGLVPESSGAGSEDVVHAGLVRGNGMVLVELERPDELHGSHTGGGLGLCGSRRRGRPLPAGEGGRRQRAERASRRGGRCEPRLQRPRPRGQCLDLRNGQPVSR